MFVVHSNHAQSWPSLGFRLKKGENRFASRDDIPADVMPKLEYLSKAKKSRDGQRFPAAIRFYEASGAAAADSEELDVELTREGLAPLSFKVLQALALKLNVDVAGLTSKKQLAAKILDEASGAAAADSDGDDDDDDSDDDA